MIFQETAVKKNFRVNNRKICQDSMPQPASRFSLSYSRVRERKKDTNLSDELLTHVPSLPTKMKRARFICIQGALQVYRNDYYKILITCFFFFLICITFFRMT